MVEDLVSAHRWFHAIDLGGGLVTPGRFGVDVPPNYTLYGIFDLLRGLDLSRARCFDVGTMDGLCAFVMKGLGARKVVACDMHPRQTFDLARRRLALDIGYETPVSALDLPTAVGRPKADLIVLAGILYHVHDPLAVLVACRMALRQGGYLLLETAYLFDEAAPIMCFNPSDPSSRQMKYPNVYWRPSKRALWGMLRLAGFEVVATRSVDARLAVLACAKRPGQIHGREPMIVAIQDRYRDAHYREGADFDAMRSDRTTVAEIAYAGPRDDRFLCRATFTPGVPYQPAWKPSSRLALVRELARSRSIQARTLAADARAQVAESMKQGRRNLRRRSRQLFRGGERPEGNRRRDPS